MRILLSVFIILFLSACADTTFVRLGQLVDGSPSATVSPTDTSHRSYAAEEETELPKVKSQPEITPQIVSKPKPTPPENIWERIIQGHQLEGIDHERIEEQEIYFKHHLPTLTALFKRSTPYIYHITEELEKRNMPTELALLPAVESGFNPFAFSPDGAAGLWQFMPETGKMYGLNQDWWQDSRRDPVAATTAALNLLERLHRRFDGDWLKALAGYNAGGGKVASAVKKNMRKNMPTDFWNLDLPSETDNYVPRLLALNNLLTKKYLEHIIPDIPNKPQLATIRTGKQIDLDVAANVIGLKTETLLELNSNFNRWSSSPSGPHRLVVPVRYASQELEKKLIALPDKDRLRWKRHKIKPGDTLSHIAVKYNVNVKAIKSANHLKSHKIRAGKDLLIPLSESVTHLALNMNRKQPRKRIQYRVRGGDSLYRIARKFRVKIADLRKWNSIGEDFIRPGQKLTVYPVQL